MTRKDYNLIALTFANRVTEVKNNYAYSEATDRVAELEIMAIDLAIALQTTNERFDRARFVEACGF